MTDLTNISQLSDKKSAAIVFIDDKFCSEKLIEQLDGLKNVFIANVNTEVGRNLREAHMIEYVPSAIFIRNGKPSNPYMGTRAILENAK